MCLFFDPYASDDQRCYASRHTYVSSQKPKWAHFPGRRNLFLFSRAPYILRTTYFSGNNACNNCSNAALTGRRRQELKPHCSEKVKMAFVASEYMVLGD
jgi:hypothetical protein